MPLMVAASNTLRSLHDEGRNRTNGDPAMQSMCVAVCRHAHIATVSAVCAFARYYIVGKMDGETMQLHINGELEGVTRVYGGMRVPPRATDGDVTVGCGMYAGSVSDVCSCLITEARVSEGVRQVNDWLWKPSWLNLHGTSAPGVRDRQGY